MRYCFLFLLFLCSQLQAQWTPDTIALKLPFAVSLLKNPEVLPVKSTHFIKKISIGEGLPSAYITHITTDREGNIWFASYGGGCGKYNGQTFELYNQTNGLPSNYVQKVFHDSRNRIWVATYGKGIACFNAGKWTTFNDSNGFPGKYVWDVCEDRFGNIWFAVERLGAVKYDNEQFITYTPDEGLCSRNIRTVFSDSRGTLWFGSDGRGMSAYNGKKFQTWTTEQGLPDNRVVSFCEYDNKLHLGTYGGGVCYFINGVFVRDIFEQGVGGELIDQVIPGNGKHLIVSTSGNGVWVYGKDKPLHYHTGNGLSNDVVLAAVEDRYGNIWTGTYGGGISVIMNSRFESLNETTGMPSNNVKCMSETGPSLWLGFSGKGLAEFRNDTLFQFGAEQGLPNPYIMALSADAQGNLWAGSSGAGIFRIKGKEVMQISNWHGLPGNYILSLYTDSRNTLWVGSYGMGFGCLKNDRLIWYKPDSLFHPEYVYQFIELNNSIYVATDQGLFSVTENRAERIPFPAGDQTNIHCLLFDRKGNLWAGTAGSGLWVRTGKEWIRFDAKELNGTDNIESLTETGNGDIIAGLWNGFLRFFIPEKSAQVQFLPRFMDYSVRRYDRNDGFPGYNCLTNSVYQTSDRTVYLGTGQGLTRFSTPPEPYNRITPPVRLGGISRNFSPLDWEALADSGMVTFDDSYDFVHFPVNPVFRYDYNHFTFHPSVTDLNSGGKSRITFKLEGYDSGFSPPVKAGDITYSNLPPGEYRLIIYSINENGIRSEQPMEWPFSIRPPFWETIWFRLVAILLFVVLLWLLYSARISVLKKRQRMLEQRIAEATEEITEKNEELKQQNEEILSQRDEISSQRDRLSEQKEHIEHIHEEQTSSIRYAQRIQEAMLPSLDVLEKSGLDHFLIFRPRDIVSGDFYWVTQQDNLLVVAVADCTGHGVPGAFMSMLGIAFLKEIITKEYITQPDVILKKLRKEIIRSLKQEGGNQRDGMDIALCAINLDTLELQFAGANNPLYLVSGDWPLVSGGVNQQPATSNQKLVEVKGDKMPIGIHERMDSFTLHTRQLQKGDCIYLFSDGMADQFGGPNGKKLKYKPLKELLEENSSLPASVQKDKTERFFDEWKGDLGQVDDVTILALKINR